MPVRTRRHKATPNNPIPGVHRHGAKWRVFAYKGNLTPVSKVFAERDLAAFRKWQHEQETIMEARLDAARDVHVPPPRVVAPLTVDGAMDAYLSTLGADPNAVPSASYKRSWLAGTDHEGRAIGPQPIDAIKPSVWRAIFTEWKAAGRAPTTLNHRRGFLLATLRLYDLDHKTALTPPVLEVLKFTKPNDDVPQELPWPLIERILAAMGRNRSWAFLWVMAETGLPPETLRRMRPADVDEEGLTMTLTTRRKGGKVSGVVLSITPEAAAAFRAYRSLGWRPVVESSLNQVWHHACEAVRTGTFPKYGGHKHHGVVGPPTPVPDCTPYVLRHSFAGRVLDETDGDLHALMVLLQHASIKQTQRYARAREQRAAKAAIAKLAAANQRARAQRFRVVIPHADPTS